MSSRRRKPLVTRKVLSDEEDDITSANDEDSRMTNGDISEGENKNEDIPEDLPEGTVVVEPEAVEDNSFKGPEFPSSKKKVLEATGYLSTVYCSACGEQINTSKKGDARRHPELSVLICKRCYKFHTSGEIKQDEDGLDEYCRWCSEGGNLFGCDYCHNAFCQACIKRNLGRAEFSKVKDAEKFKCYVCDPTPLAAMVEQCNSVIEMIDKEFEKLNESAKKKKDVEKQKSSSKSDSKDKTKEDDKSKASSKSLVIKLPGLGPKTSTPKSKETPVTVTTPGMVKVQTVNTSRTSTPTNLVSLVRQPVAVAPKQTLAPLQSLLNQNTATSKQNIIFVEPTQGSAKQLVYVQPKPHQVPMMSGMPLSQQPKMSAMPLSQQAREPLNWSNVTVKNVPFITDQLIQSSNELLNLLKSVRVNVQGSSNALSHIAMEGRKTAISCMKSGVDLFLGQLSSIVGTDIVQSSASKAMPAPTALAQSAQTAAVKLTGGNSSLISTSEKDLIVLDSENDDSRMEVVEVTDSDKGNNSEKDVTNVDTVSIDSKDVEDKPSDKNEKKDDTLNNDNKDPEKEKKSDGTSKNKDKKSEKEKKSDDSKKSKSGDSKKLKSDVSKKSEKESDSESSTENENDAAHLELLQELQELSGTVEDKKEEQEKSSNKKDGKKKKDEKEDEKSSDKKDIKEKKEEKSSNKKDKENSEKKMNGKKEEKVNEDEKSVKKEESSDDESSSGSESDIEDSDNSKDSDFDIKTERRTRRSDLREAEKNKFKQLRQKRKEKERSAKKKQKEEKSKDDKKKKRKGSDDSDFNDELEDEIDKLEKEPGVKKGKVKKEKEKEDKDKSKKDKKTDQKKDEKSKKEKKKGTDLDDLSSTEEDNVEEDQEDNEDEEVPMEQDNEDDATEDLSGVENDDDEEVVEDSSDSEIVLSPRKKKAAAEKKKGDKKKGKTESGSNTEEEITPPKKKRLRSSLLDAKLSDSESDFQPLKKKQKKRKAESSEEKSDNSSDSEQEFIALGKKSKGKGKKNQKKKNGTGKKRKRIKKVESSGDEDDSENKTEAESDELEEMKKKKKRKRKKKGEDDSDEENEEDEDGSPSKGKRKDIRKLITNKKLKDSTKAAAKAEEERRARIAEKQKKYNNIVQEVDESSPTKCPITKQLILEREEETKEPVLEVDKDLVVKLKPHQVEAVEFLWNCTVESLKMLKEEKVEGAGCILAHCMGLGKTLSVIAFLHTMMGNYETTEFSTALIVCPLNTVLNWQNEVNMWLEHNEVQLEVNELASVKMNETRARMLEEWHEDGGIMIIGYEMFRNLSQGSNCRSKKIKASFKKTLLDPGPDFVVCDEGHVLKNDASALSKAMNQIKTKRRIVLTGTPLQNNLVEYHCMVNFVKPSLLGTRKEFLNRFVNPITNGQCTDSSSHDVRLMKRRAHILHEKLAGCVQRKDYSALTKYLPPKHEYVIAVRMSNVQCDLYSKYLELGGYSGPGDMIKSKGAKLFSDYQALMRIWTHPWVLKMDEIRQEMKNMFDDEDSFIDDSSTSESESEAKSTSGSESDVSFNSGSEDDKKKKKKGKKESEEEPVKESFAGEIVKKWKTRSRGEFNDDDFQKLPDEIETPFSTGWWADYVKEEDQYKMELGGKLMLLFEILRMCEEIGDKVLVFSQSLLSLDILEAYLEHIDKQNDEILNKDKEEGDKDKKDDDDKDKEKDDKKDKEDKAADGPTDEMFGKTWLKGQDYLRMDGSTSAGLRADMAKNFNDPDNYRLRLFLISTKAGGLGINLVAANRVIIFDASWNPSHDVQSIFRVYRFGQTKPVYVYRFLAQGTMEEKIYERQVTKQSLSQRVIDEHQIDRHFNSNDLRELYTFKPDRLDDPNRQERPTPALPKDTLLAELLTDKKEWIVGYHEHDSLLENKIDQELSEEERKAAWEEFENERKGLINTVQQRFMGMPNPNFAQHYQYGNTGMLNMGLNPQLNQENLLRIVQEMKAKFPHLPQEQLTMQVQNVIRNMISRQIQQQQWEQRRQLEQREIQQQQQLQQLQARIMMQQNQLRMQQQPGRGINMPLGGLQRPASSTSLLANTLMNGRSPSQPSTSKKS